MARTKGGTVVPKSKNELKGFVTIIYIEGEKKKGRGYGLNIFLGDKIIKRCDEGVDS